MRKKMSGLSVVQKNNYKRIPVEVILRREFSLDEKKFINMYILEIVSEFYKNSAIYVGRNDNKMITFTTVNAVPISSVYYSEIKALFNEC